MSIQRKTFQSEVGGKKLTLEISPLAEQTNAAVLVKYGETAVLTSVVMSEKEAATDYLPLKVDYEEKFYAAGKIIGSRFIRRESRPSEEAILSGRVVDRAIRPLFDNRIRREIQIVVTVLAYDEENEPDFLGLIGASAALAISDVPWNGPVAGVRVAKIGNDLKVNPNNSEMQKPDFAFETFVAGLTDQINMIELGGNEVPEGEIIQAFGLAQREINKLIEFQKEVIKQIGKFKTEVELFEFDPALRATVSKFLAGRLEKAVYQGNKGDYKKSLAEIKTQLFSHLSENDEKTNLKSAELLFEEAVDELVHKNILEKEMRPDGRQLDEVRELQGEVGIFERTHGSAIFFRGSTHALAVATLAPPGAEQLIETMETTGKRRFMLHYNFPPYSVGEIGSFRGPGRREIGHGALAEKALRPLVPKMEDFPYTIRLVSEILSSNGSSSMATVCAGTLSLMDAGVPIKKPAAGIAMGLIMGQAASNKRQAYKVLTDIQGPEDHHGDMDLKVAGTDSGVNAVQMDVKVDGVNLEIIEKSLAQAKSARLQILKFMESILAKPRPNLSSYVPTILPHQINPERIGDVIGPGGKIIKGLIKKFDLVDIDIEEDGRIFVSASKKENAEAALAEIKSLTREYKVGEIIEGEVIKILDFGAIVDLGGGKDGMVHVSELKNGYVKTVEEVVKKGDFVRAKIIRVDPDGHIGLSIKQLQ